LYIHLTSCLSLLGLLGRKWWLQTMDLINYTRWWGRHFIKCFSFVAGRENRNFGCGSGKRRQPPDTKADEGVTKQIAVHPKLLQKKREMLNDFSDVFVLDWIIYTENEWKLSRNDLSFLPSLREMGSCLDCFRLNLGRDRVLGNDFLNEFMQRNFHSWIIKAPHIIHLSFHPR
jgi:hypothetical protein